MFTQALKEKMPPQMEQIRAFSLAERSRFKAQWKQRYGDAEYDPEKDDSPLGELILDAEDNYRDGPLKGRLVIPGPKQVSAHISDPIVDSVLRAVFRRCGIALKQRHAKTCLDFYRRQSRKLREEAPGSE
jgi:hypothetical protein